MVNQFLDVLSIYEICCTKIIDIVSSAGGSNLKYFYIIFGELEECCPWPDKPNMSIPHPISVDE